MVTKRKTTVKRTKQRPATPQRARRDAWRMLFLAQLRINGNITRACQTAGIERSTAYRLRADDPTFDAEWKDAIETSIDRLEEEAYRRAREGVVKGVFYKGQIVGFENEYSDSLMALMLKANRPDKFGDKLTIKISPDQFEKLKRYNMTPGDAFEKLIQNLDKVENE